MLTRGGWAAAGLSLLALVTGRVFGVIELFVVAVAGVGAVSVGLFRVRAARPRYTVERTVEPSPASVGEPAVVQVSVVSRRRGRSPRLALWERVGPPSPAGSAPGPELGITIDVPRLRRGAEHVMRYALPTGRRGVVQLGPATAELGDPFGLARRVVGVNASGASEALVLPSFVPVSFAGGVSSGPLAARLRTAALVRGGDEFHSLRPYVDGDDPRRIDWKATARSQDVLVRVAAPDSLRRCTVVFDTSGPWPSPAAFEWAVSAVASVAIGAHRAGLDTRVIGPGVDLRGPDVARATLHWLAVVEPGAGELPSPRRGDGTGVVAIVCAAATSPAALAARRRIDPQQVTVSFDAVTWSTVPFTQAWATLVGPA